MRLTKTHRKFAFPVASIQTVLFPTTTTVLLRNSLLGGGRLRVLEQREIRKRGKQIDTTTNEGAADIPPGSSCARDI